MTIKFTIHFTPTGDEKLFIEGLCSAIMPAELAQGALPLEYEGDSLWSRELGVLSHPSDNKTFDHEGERTVPDIIGIFR